MIILVPPQYEMGIREKSLGFVLFWFGFELSKSLTLVKKNFFLRFF